jgi:hypothetical protein
MRQSLLLSKLNSKCSRSGGRIGAAAGYGTSPVETIRDSVRNFL